MSKSFSFVWLFVWYTNEERTGAHKFTTSHVNTCRSMRDRLTYVNCSVTGWKTLGFLHTGCCRKNIRNEYIQIIALGVGKKPDQTNKLYLFRSLFLPSYAELYESRFSVTFWFLSICKMQFGCVVSCLSVCEFIVSGVFAI